MGEGQRVFEIDREEKLFSFVRLEAVAIEDIGVAVQRASDQAAPNRGWRDQEIVIVGGILSSDGNGVQTQPVSAM